MLPRGGSAALPGPAHSASVSEPGDTDAPDLSDRTSAPPPTPRRPAAQEIGSMIRKLKSGQYRLYSRKVDPVTKRRRNLGTFDTRAAAEKHERAVQFFKRH